MYRIVVGEPGEYGNRLVDYLETHIREPVRILRFTQPEAFAQCEESADIYILDEMFAGALFGGEVPVDREKLIYITEKESGEDYCRYQLPGRLLDMIEERLAAPETGKPASKAAQKVCGLFSPVFEPALREIAMTCMEPGDLYLGMEDIGSAEKSSNMSDLCYYIRLREERIMQRLKEMARQEQGLFYVESPDFYLDLLELTPEDYRWFFSKLKKESVFSHVYVGLGCVAAGNRELRSFLNRIILLDSRGNGRQHSFCERMERFLSNAGNDSFKGECSRIWREDVFHESSG